MYFTLSKLLPALILPFMWFFWLILFFLIYLIKQKKWILSFITALVLLSTYLLSLHSLVAIHKVSQIKNYTNYSLPNEKTDVAIVLGGFMDYDSLYGYGVGNAFDRLLVGIRLVKQKKARFLLLSGGKSDFFDKNYPDEAILMKQFINEFSILPDSELLLETSSRNTIENARFSKVILDSLNLSHRIYLITNATHLDRAEIIFTQMGFEVLSVPTDLPYNKYTNAPQIMKFIPDAAALLYWNQVVREWLGNTWHRFFYKQ